MQTLQHACLGRRGMPCAQRAGAALPTPLRTSQAIYRRASRRHVAPLITLSAATAERLVATSDNGAYPLLNLKEPGKDLEQVGAAAAGPPAPVPPTPPGAPYPAWRAANCCWLLLAARDRAEVCGWYFLRTSCETHPPAPRTARRLQPRQL